VSAYWIGLATLPVLALIAWTTFSIIDWLLWWRDMEGVPRKGFCHDFDSREDGKWYPRTRHTHYWPSETPWWLIRRCEPLRVRLCLRSPDRLPAGESEEQ
jgi:hypothetical protein